MCVPQECRAEAPSGMEVVGSVMSRGMFGQELGEKGMKSARHWSDGKDGKTVPGQVSCRGCALRHRWRPGEPPAAE